ncbi:type IV pilus biogenesis/stability protein PilW [Propionivibrio dicarboxylicus]|uniref:Type IV pilus assembly protein PilF n=1 Tax=Propionivibrio dicarboxylicus TaxID=83767 RepID=A0A1G8MRC6_9RHOO|nr:type IV pilus biogenesis/stability protein PilW [Propionivibrio dicarboxylicus]SDI70599.1 type IV pilus assembly protein PilF [Propionivibrio dicarboxylicus]
MTTIFRSLFVFLLATVVSVPFVRAQSPSPVYMPEAAQPAVPKDNRTRAKLHTELASLYFQSGNLIVALEELTIAISIDPDYAPAYSTRGLALYHIREFDSAEKDFRRALSLNEKDPEINNNYGWYLCHTGKVRESIPYFEKAIRNPLYMTPEIAHLNAGACHAMLGELDTAEAYVRKTLRFSPDNPQALFQLANISYQRGNVDAARAQLMSIVRSQEPSAEVLWLLLRVERRLGDATAEASLASQLRRKYPDSQETQMLLKGNFE